MKLRILDTDHISLILRGNLQVIDRLETLDSIEWAITIVSVQEIFNGWIVRLNDPRNQHREVELYTFFWESNHFFKQAQILNFDASAQAQYDRLRQGSSTLNKRRLEKDLKIASIALVNQATIVTRNQRDFQLVPNLHLENWLPD